MALLILACRGILFVFGMLVGATKTEHKSCASSGTCAQSLVQLKTVSSKITLVEGLADLDLSRPCTLTRVSRCCGDGVCDGPETEVNCPADCDDDHADDDDLKTTTTTTDDDLKTTTTTTRGGGKPGGGARPCTDTRMSRCCGDDVCDGPETEANCPADCGGDDDDDDDDNDLNTTTMTTTRGGKPGGGAGLCHDTLTSRCCGDDVCDGPETEANCPADCGGDDGGNPGGGAPPCTDTLTSRCCGDDECGGAETEANCPADCGGDDHDDDDHDDDDDDDDDHDDDDDDLETTTTTTRGGGKPGGGARPCTETRTSRCCGDGVCGGPETEVNCAADCSGAPMPMPPPPAGPPAPPPPPPGATCTTDPTEKPDKPTLCTAENQGCCECGESNVKTFVFWTAGGTTQRCFHTFNFPLSSPSGGPLPVVLHMSGYSGGKKPSESGGDMGKAAKYYGFTTFTLGNSLKDGAGGFGLEFGNSGIANDQNPTPCSRDDSRDIEYLEQIFEFIADNPMLDANKVYTEGFSQNSMFAIYAAVCFADKVAGSWQGGSGQARTGFTPVTPGYQGQCSFDSHALHGRDCCKNEFCTECQYWPLWPKTCSHKIVDCIAAYTDDKIACGSDWYMYEAMVHEGNDARLLSFPVPDGDSQGGHKDPRNKWAWFAGCLGVTPSCSSSCTASFDICVDGAAGDKAYDKFESCEDQLKAGALDGCIVGCAPTLSMLQRSESAVTTLSQGHFGTQTDLPKTNGSAPKPNCKIPFGPLDSTTKCKVPSSFTVPPIAPEPDC